MSSETSMCVLFMQLRHAERVAELEKSTLGAQSSQDR